MEKCSADDLYEIKTFEISWGSNNTKSGLKSSRWKGVKAKLPIKKQ